VQGSIPTSRWGFPDVHTWPDDDVVCVGADLEPSTLVDAYSRGLFPMYLDRKHTMLGWWSPLERGVLNFGDLRVTRSLRQSRRRFTMTINHAFAEVITACSSVSRTGGWITTDFIDAYVELHRLGMAHSVEVWNHDHQLVGGLYGVRLERFFAGESMFHLERDASKVALWFLVEVMQLAGMSLLDTQWATDHLRSLGVSELPRQEYLARLSAATSPHR
jgi:leucyl/phenylalanyl-tRNA--protein transferase